MTGSLLLVRILFPMTDADSEQRYLVFALPIATAAIITAALGDLSFGLLVASVLGIASAYCAATVPEIAGSEFTGSLEALEFAMVFTAAGVAGAFTVHRAERMGRFVLCGLVVSIVTAIPLLAFWLLDVNRDNADLPWLGLAAGLSGVGSSVLGAGFFIVVPAVFGIPTRLQLFELADTGHPLMRRLREEAPGTYHHSMMVGALAERAADSIGADPLLAKVGAHCHDIGKLLHPGYFIENMLDSAPSPHDSIQPGESAKMIRSHVEAGVDFARKYRLPPTVRAFIPEHHGTRLVTFFYRKAVSDGEPVDPEPYQYRGPRPQSRETAIVMLADSCEALARSRTNRDAASISELVDAIFAERLSEGQLDECDITLRDLQQVARSFKDTLRAIYHPRIEYPQPTAEEMIAIATGGT
jgi:putative nucleotidyltransferase with HDIG domain